MRLWRSLGLLALLFVVLPASQAHAQISCTGVGAWSATTTYAVGARVTFQGGLYEALQSTTNVPPNYCPECGWWKFLNTCGTAPPDTTPPSVPSGLNSPSHTSSSVSLSWTASTDNAGGSGVASYEVFRNGASAGTSTSTSFTDGGRTASTTYSYTVRAKDNAGNVTTVTRSYIVFAALTGPIGGGSQNAGRTIPIGFTLDQDRGRNPLADGSPTTWQVDCAHPGTALGPVTSAQGTLNPGSGGRYTFNWKTSSSWAGTCRIMSFSFTAPGWAGTHADFLVVFGS